MALTYTYTDQYLTRHVTEAIEARALADVAELGDMPTGTDYAEKLTIIRAYIIVCLESQAEADDLYVTKLKSYRSEYDSLLKKARAAQTAASVEAAATSGTSSAGFFTVPILRG
jgi:hypothetical protein